MNTDGTPVTSLLGYTIYQGTSASSLTQSVVVSGSTTSYTITGLAAGTWYFGVAADATDGTQSTISNVGSKTI
jgi:high-affinity Fe2+/Pb2+ permease